MHCCRSALVLTNSICKCWSGLLAHVLVWLQSAAPWDAELCVALAGARQPGEALHRLSSKACCCCRRQNWKRAVDCNQFGACMSSSQVLFGLAYLSLRAVPSCNAISCIVKVAAVWSLMQVCHVAVSGCIYPNLFGLQNIFENVELVGKLGTVLPGIASMTSLQSLLLTKCLFSMSPGLDVSEFC